MKIRATAIVLALSCGLTAAAEARPARHAPQRIALFEATSAAVQADAVTRNSQWRAARWSLGDPAYYSTGDQGIEVRWRLNKIKIRAPLDFN